MHDTLKELLVSRNMSHFKLALLADIDPSDLNKAIAGKKPFYPLWKMNVATALNVPVQELFPISEYLPKED